MDYEIKDCIDAGTEYCPCHLAETGDCILCSHLQGKDFCDCTNWKGVCIYQEYVWNGNMPKEDRRNCLCKICNKEVLDTNLVQFTLIAKHKLVQELSRPGSFIFVRNPETNAYFDAPISIMDKDIKENTIKFVVEIKGVKTKMLNKLNENDNMFVKGPYWNGVLGLKNIYTSKDGISVIFARGIGMAPMVPVMKKLYANGNKIIAVIDKSGINNIFIKDYLDMCNAELIEINMLNNGELSPQIKSLIAKYEDAANIFFCSGPDIFISDILDKINSNIKTACCNNAKMCCGEGICGTCSTRYKGHIVKKLCKVQIDPVYIFKGRRFL